MMSFRFFDDHLGEMGNERLFESSTNLKSKKFNLFNILKLTMHVLRFMEDLNKK